MSMNIKEAFTANQIATTLRDYHLHLHKTYNLPPLTGFKPMHKMAESLGFKSGEQLKAALAEPVTKCLDLDISVQLYDPDNPSTVIIQIYDFFDDVTEHTVRAQIEDQQAALIVTVNPLLLGTPKVVYDDCMRATVYFGIYAITVSFENDQVDFTFYEKESNTSNNSYNIDDFTIIDSQSDTY